MGDKQKTLGSDKKDDKIVQPPSVGWGDKKGRWVEADEPKDPNEIYLEVGEEFIGRYVATKPNPLYKNDVIHQFQVEGDPEIKHMYGKTNLDRWLEPIEPGTIVGIKRLPDQQVKQPKPLQKFKVWVWKEGG